MIDEPIVMISWSDSRRGEGWVRTDEIHAEVTRCRSVGWIISSTKEAITIVGHLGENPSQCCGEITIPRNAISNITALRKRARS